MTTLAPSSPPDLASVRRKLVLDGLGIVVSAVGFGFVYGLTARTVAGFSPIDVMAMSVFAFAGAAQFAAVGYVASGVPWAVIGILTGLLNARHVLYSAALAPWFRGRSFGERAVAAHVLTDESFALSIAHFRRLGRFDAFGYWFAAIGVDVHPVVLRDARGRPDRRRDRRPGAARHRRDLPGGDGRARGRADHRAARARRGRRRGDGGRRRVAGGVDDRRGHRGRRRRAGGRAARARGDGRRDGADRERGLGATTTACRATSIRPEADQK